MAHTRFIAEVLTPEGQVYRGEVEMVSTMTTVGTIGLLAGHEPLLGRLEPTELRLYRTETEILRYAQAEGYVQVAAGRVLVLVEEAIEVANLNAAALADRVATARAALDAAQPDSFEGRRAALDLRRAEVFLGLAGGGTR